MTLGEPFTHGEVEAAALAMVTEMFAPHELPVDEDLWNHYYETAHLALKAAARVRHGVGELTLHPKEK
jgi:hypothetical protein